MTLAALPSIAPRPRADIARPGLIERTLIIGVIFINQFGTPTTWFSQNTGASSGPTDNFLLSYGSLAIIGLLAIGLVGNGDAVVKVLAAEPLMVVYFVGIGLSPIWSDRFSESLAAVTNVMALIGLAIILLVRFRQIEIFQMLTVAFTLGILLDLFWIFAMGSLGRSANSWDGLATQKNALGNHGLIAVLVFLMAARLFRRFRFPFYVMASLSVMILVGSQSKTSLGAGLVAIRFMLDYLRTRSLNLFVWYRLVVAAILIAAWVTR
jgi:hypothetical protein